MPTDIAVHDKDKEHGNAMNINPNHGNSRKEKRMNVITKACRDIPD
jgi:hypothetical protein